MQITKGMYKNMECAILENDNLRVKVLKQGGKIISVCSKQSGREFFYQTEGKEYRLSPYDGRFLDGEFSGFDDMFPTIDRCIYPEYPFEGSVMPDHGEVWTLPWDIRKEEEKITLKVHGIRLPYILEKHIYLDKNTVKISYSVKNAAAYGFYFLWAAHPLIRCSEKTKLIIPGAEKIINMMNDSTRLGRYGTIHNWPVTVTSKKENYDMSCIGKKELKLCEKYYIYNQIPAGHLTIEDSEWSVNFEYDVEKVPYLGVWVNEGGYAGQYNVALEPCTAPYDDLNLAVKMRRAPVLGAGEEYNWELNLTFNDR